MKYFHHQTHREVGRAKDLSVHLPWVLISP